MAELIFSYEQLQYKLILSLVSSPDETPIVAKMITLEDFSNDRYKLIYKAMLDVYKPNSEYKPSEIQSKLVNDGVWLEIGELDKDIAKNESVLTVANLLKNESIKAKINKHLKQSISDLNANKETTLGTIGNVTATLQSLGMELTKEDELTEPEHINNFLENLLNEEKQTVEAIPSMYPTLDKYTGGWKPSQLITVGARTGVGKTVVAINSLIAAALAGRSVLMFSLEMERDESYTRIMSCLGDIPQSQLVNDFSPEGIETKKRLAEQMAKMKIIIDDTPTVTIDYIKSKSLQIAQSDNGLDFIIIDYLQLITPTSRSRNRQEEVAEISRTLKVLSKELQVPIMVLVQLKRPNGSEDEERLPTKDDIRESGAIAQDSNIVLIIHRDTRQKEDTNPNALFILDKNRAGPAGKIFEVKCLLDRSRFEDKHYGNSNNEEITTEDVGIDGFGDSFDDIEEFEDIW